MATVGRAAFSTISSREGVISRTSTIDHAPLLLLGAQGVDIPVDGELEPFHDSMGRAEAEQALGLADVRLGILDVAAALLAMHRLGVPQVREARREQRAQH